MRRLTYTHLFAHDCLDNFDLFEGAGGNCLSVLVCDFAHGGGGLYRKPSGDVEEGVVDVASLLFGGCEVWVAAAYFIAIQSVSYIEGGGEE